MELLSQGGGALIRGLDVYLSDIIKLPVKLLMNLYYQLHMEQAKF